VTHGVTFVVIGGAAVQCHGLKRPRDDLDLFIEPSAENAATIVAALATLRPPIIISPEDKKRIAKPTIQLQLGFTGVELLGHIGGVDFEEAKAEAILVEGPDIFRCYQDRI
jgi:hypothetical protein